MTCGNVRVMLSMATGPDVVIDTRLLVGVTVNGTTYVLSVLCNYDRRYQRGVLCRVL